MSLLFCSWATEGAEEKEEDSSQEEEHTEDNECKENGINNHHLIPEDKKEESKDTQLNGGCHDSKDVIQKPKPSMFILWKNPGLDDKSEGEDDEEEEEEEEETQSQEVEKINEEKEEVLNTTNGVEKETESKEEKSPEKKEPLFFAVWKDPNKEDEYISDSSSEYVSEEEEEEPSPPSPTSPCSDDKLKVPEIKDENGGSQSDNAFNSLLGETNGSDDLFNSIANSVSAQMTTIFCDDEDFDIKKYDESDNDNGNDDFTGDNHFDSVFVSNGKRSRSASSHSVARSVQSNSSDRSHSFSLRPKKDKNYDFFSKPKKISKYFEPGTFIDKTLYKTHRCDIKIKKFKLEAKHWEDLAPARRKRKPVESEEDLPLSKRKKVSKPKPRSLNSITKREQRCEEEDGEYHGVCKFVKAQCPLCWNFWQLSQTYGQHVLRQTCQLKDFSAPDVENKQKAQFITVHPSTNKTDSYVSTSGVPSLKLLSRGGLMAGNSTSEVAISVKEGLEYYHSLVLPGNADERNLFSYISRLGKITLVSSVKQFEGLCRDPLKVAIYLEKKISRCRAKLHPGHLLTRNWVEKYKFFLALPLHDIYLSVVTEGGWRVLEVPDRGVVRLLCLVCSSLTCNGCSAREKQSQEQSRKIRKIKEEPVRKPRKKVKTKVKSKKSKGKELKGSKSSGIKLQLHLCKKCNRYFKTVSALKSHSKVCRC